MDTARLDALLAATARLGASALHLVPGRAPSLRVQRRFVEGDETAVQASDVEELTRDMMFSDHRELLEQNGFVDDEPIAVGQPGAELNAGKTIERESTLEHGIQMQLLAAGTAWSQLRVNLAQRSHQRFSGVWLGYR